MTNLLNVLTNTEAFITNAINLQLGYIMNKYKASCSLKKILILFIVIAFHASCMKNNTLSVKSKSGNIYIVLSEGQMRFANGDKALVVKYQRQSDIEKAADLKIETDDLVTAYTEKADKLGCSNILISAVIKINQTGFVTRNKEYAAIYKKTTNGTWVFFELN